MKKEQADQVALKLAESLIQTHHQYLLSQSTNSERTADEVVALIEALSARLQNSTLD